jgi:diguanylate cyclase (GGDEF)-like protein
MDFSSPVADTTALFIQEIGALLFGMVFLFLWRQSRVVYFGLWSVAWALRFIAAIFGYALMQSGNGSWLAPYAVFEFAFVIVLVAAARAGFGSAIKDWRTVLRLIAILPIFVALVYALGFLSHLEAYHASHTLALCVVYFYNFALLRRNEGVGGRIFRFSLLLLAAAFLEHAIVFLYLYNAGNAPEWARYLQHETYYDFVLHCLLVFSAMAMWSETQIDRIRELQSDLDQVRRESKRNTDLDRLTGLQNQAALARRIEAGVEFPGVVAVCDMDNFKEVNDRYGHLIGDEILRNIGSLVQASIRHEDEAFRWGGDEFVILFVNQFPEVASKRMRELETRLQEFRVRGFGTLPISISWGTADARGRPLRDALDEADRSMYVVKRSRAAETARERGEDF